MYIGVCPHGNNRKTNIEVYLWYAASGICPQSKRDKDRSMGEDANIGSGACVVQDSRRGGHRPEMKPDAHTE